MAEYYHHNHQAFPQPPPLTVIPPYATHQYLIPPKQPQFARTQCQCCEETRQIGPNSFVRSCSRCCEHRSNVDGNLMVNPAVIEAEHHRRQQLRHLSNFHPAMMTERHQMRPASEQDKSIVVTAVVPAKALDTPAGVTVHLKAATKGRTAVNNTRQPPATTVIIAPAAPSATVVHHQRPMLCVEPPATPINYHDTARSSSVYVVEDERIQERHNNVQHFDHELQGVRPSTSFIRPENQAVMFESFRPADGMSEFLQRYRCQYARNGNNLLRSVSQQHLLDNNNRNNNKPAWTHLPESEIALRNCRRWYH